MREIDLACEAATASSSIRQPPGATTSDACAKPSSSKLGGKVRQSTLEKFVDSFAKRRKENEGLVKSRVSETKVGASGVATEGCMGSEHQSPSVSVDTEAAKTWIYPSNFCFSLSGIFC